MNCYEMAKKMLGLEDGQDLPISLSDRLQSVEGMIHIVKPRGNFESSQVVACMVEQWRREQPDVLR